MFKTVQDSSQSASYDNQIHISGKRYKYEDLKKCFWIDY